MDIYRIGSWSVSCPGCWWRWTRKTIRRQQKTPRYSIEHVTMYSRVWRKPSKDEGIGLSWETKKLIYASSAAFCMLASGMDKDTPLPDFFNGSDNLLVTLESMEEERTRLLSPTGRGVHPQNKPRTLQPGSPYELILAPFYLSQNPQETVRETSEHDVAVSPPSLLPRDNSEDPADVCWLVFASGVLNFWKLKPGSWSSVSKQREWKWSKFPTLRRQSSSIDPAYSILLNIATWIR